MRGRPGGVLLAGQRPVAAGARIMTIVCPMAHRLVTDRLVLRPWSVGDAEAALGAYGDAEVARWLAPAMDRIGDLAAMRVVLQQWAAEDERMITPAGRWAIELRDTRKLQKHNKWAEGTGAGQQQGAR